MPGTPTSRGLTTLASADVISSFATTINSVTSSVNTAIAYTPYNVADSTALAAITGMTNGQLAYLSTPKEYWIYDSTAVSWKLWYKGRTNYTPTFTNWGTSPSVFYSNYSVNAGICTVDVRFSIASLTGLFAAVPTISVPIAYANYNSNFQPTIGTIEYYNNSMGQSHTGAAKWASSTTVDAKYLGTNGLHTSLAQATGNPLTEAWAVGDVIWLSMSYAII
jgi:hypothetical protein